MNRFFSGCVVAVMLFTCCRAEEGFSILPMATAGGSDAAYSVVEYTDDIIIDAGDDWDRGDVLNPSVIMADGRYYNYYSGWDGETWRTGLATSEDGIHWEKAKSYVLDVRPGAWDDSYIAANGCAVLKDDSVLYYYQGTSSKDGRTQIGLAISNDRVSFVERTDEPVLCVGQEGDWDACAVADPYVISFGGRMYMYYLGQDSLGVQRLGVAMSEDGYAWTKYRNNPIMDTGVRGAFDENGLGEPCVAYRTPYFYMLYTGRSGTEQRNLGVAVSRDGVNWKKLNHYGIIELADNAWDNQVVCDPTWMENKDGTFTVWYGGGNVASPDQELNGRIGAFTMTLGSGMDFLGFDANAWNSGDHREYINGVYELEGDMGSRFTWASEKVSMVMKNDDTAKSVVIRGYVNMDMFARIGTDRLALTVQLDGADAGSLEVVETGMFEIRVPKWATLGPYFNLSVNASTFINHKALGDSEDMRNLSWILNSIVQE